MNLLQAINKCKAFTANSKDSRVSLANVVFDRGYVLATSGHYLAVAETPGADRFKGEKKVVIAGTEQEVPDYPQWERVLVDNDRLVDSIEVNREVLVAGLKFLIKSWKELSKNASRSQKKDRNLVPVVTIESTYGGTIVKLRDYPVSFTASDCLINEKPEFTKTGFNAEFLLKSIEACEGETAVISTQGDNLRACVVSGKGNLDFRVILMPVNLREDVN